MEFVSVVRIHHIVSMIRKQIVIIDSSVIFYKIVVSWIRYGKSLCGLLYFLKSRYVYNSIIQKIDIEFEDVSSQF